MSTDEPPMKIQRLNDETISCDNVILQYVTKIMNSKNNLKLILADEYSNPVPLTKAYVGYIKDVKNISNTMKILNEKLPLKDLNHLKRVRGRNIIISHVDDFSTALVLQEFIKNNMPELDDVFENFNEIDVPTYMPKLKWQYADVCKKWACNFHPDVRLERLCNGLDGNLDVDRTYMAMTFETVKWFYRKNNVDEEVLKTVNVSVVVDPSIKSVVAVSFDHRVEHPIQHSAMLVIDNVAKTQGGGAWSSEFVTLSGIDEKLLGYLKERFPTVKFGAKKYFHKNAVEGEEGKDYDGPYLCTNYYVYMLREPCIMCSMALTHARVKRVYFCFENKELGGLSSRAKLHTVPYLNHRYEVFTSFL